MQDKNQETVNNDQKENQEIVNNDQKENQEIVNTDQKENQETVNTDFFFSYWYFVKQGLFILPSIIVGVYASRAFSVQNNPSTNNNPLAVTVMVVDESSSIEGSLPSEIQIEIIEEKLLRIDKKYGKNIRKLNFSLQNFNKIHREKFDTLGYQKNPNVSSRELNQFENDKRIYNWWLQGLGDSKILKLNVSLENSNKIHLEKIDTLRYQKNPNLSSFERNQFKIYNWWLRGLGDSGSSIGIKEEGRVKMVELGKTIKLKSKYFRLQSALYHYKNISHMGQDQLMAYVDAYTKFQSICMKVNEQRSQSITSLNNTQKSKLFLSYNLIGIVDEQTFDLNQFQQKMASLFEKQVRNRDKISEIFLQNVSYVKDIGFIPSTSEQIIYLGKLNLLIEENTIMIDSLKTESEELKQSYINMNDSVVELARSFRISTSEFYI